MCLRNLKRRPHWNLQTPTKRVIPKPLLPWYHVLMTTVEIIYRYTTQPTESVAFALAGIRDVYGIRRVSIDSEARRLRVEFDATRLTRATVTKLVRLSGLEITEELPLIPLPPQPAPAV